MSLISCRFYEEKYPEIDSFVMVNVRLSAPVISSGSHTDSRIGQTSMRPTASVPSMTHVHQIAEMGAYVKLLEYDNIDGMILLSELSRRRIRSIQKLIRVGRNEVVVVLRVDKEKGSPAGTICLEQCIDQFQATSISQNAEFHQKILSNVKSGTTRARWYKASCGT